MSDHGGKMNQAFQGDLKPAAGAKSSKYLNQVELADMTVLPGGPYTQDTSNADAQALQFNPAEKSAFARCTMHVQESVKTGYKEHKSTIWTIVRVLLLLAYFAYFAYAMYYEFGDEGSYRLLVCTVFGSILLLLHLVRHHLAFLWDRWDFFLTSDQHWKVRRIIRLSLYMISLVATITLIIVLVASKTPRNLFSLAGLAGFFLLCFVTSHNPAMIQWHTVFWGFSIQFYFAIVILKTRPGFDAFDWLGDRITEFLSYSDEGARLVFGDFASLKLADGGVLNIKDAYEIHNFAFKILPVITFFGAVISILYYLGVMEVVIKVFGRFLSFCLGTTPAESLNAAGNIFVSMTEGPLMIRPFLARMTTSELHAVMTGGFATIAGGVLGAYISFGVPADHLLTASVMSAPAALAISKMTYPEIEVPTIDDGDYEIENTKESNIVEAACNGATLSGKIIASVMVNVIAFLSLLKFVNATLTWFGNRVGVADLSFELICSYVLYPVALFMGTEPDDCRVVAELVGVKTFTNEFIAYQRLSGILDNRKTLDNYTGVWFWDDDDILLNNTVPPTRLVDGVISRRSELIATYALCGFSNFGSMGILLGSLSAMAPDRRNDMSKIIFRAMLAGNVACFCTACIAGLLYEDFN